MDIRSRVVAAFAAIAMLIGSGALSTPAAAEEVPAQPALCNGLPGDGEAPVGSNAPANAPISPGSYFGFLNSSGSDQRAIRDRVLATINSTNGRYCAETGDTDGAGNPLYEVRHGSIRLVSWSWNDWEVTRALIRARDRGATVQAIAARNINQTKRYKPWVARDGMRGKFAYHRGSVPADLLDEEHNWVHDCSGGCRGGRIAHAKYFLFQDAGQAHLRDIVVQTSMNLTVFAFQGQWNQATVMHDAASYASFLTVFNQAARGSRHSLTRWDHGSVADIFFPKGSAPDPALQLLNSASCAGRPPVRVINYAFYDDRGIALARRLRELWNAGCDVKVIYSLSTRKLLGILRSSSGRGRIPVKQTVIRNRRGQIVKYNHSKWVSVGNTVQAGSANWSNRAWSSDEQFQQFTGSAPYLEAFDKTWNQGVSRAPRTGRLGEDILDAPKTLRWGKGELKFLTPEG